jgi:60 kDa SS-A/Ro ribonucleoprotein
MKHSKHFVSGKGKNSTATVQTKPIPGREADMVQNNAGGYSFKVGAWEQFKRFLILGSEGGTFYCGEKELTIENAQNSIACIKHDGIKAVQMIVDVSHAGRAPKNDPAIFALALACTYGDQATKTEAYRAISAVCRIGTHLFTFCEDVNNLRGWSRGLRTGVSNFYTEKDKDKVAMQLVKYRQRNGWTHRDVVRLAHPSAGKGRILNSLFKYAVGKSETAQHPLVDAFEEIQAFCKKTLEKKDAFSQTDLKRVIKLITDHEMTWEMVPTEILAFPQVWEAMLLTMPSMAMVRNLGKMTSIGLLAPGSGAVKTVLSKIRDTEKMTKARVHPMQLLLALRTYAQGRGFKGSLTWDPVTSIVDALDEAFYVAYGNVEPTGKRWLLGLDVSGSMQGSTVNNSILSCAEACGAMALVTAAVENDPVFVAFNTEATGLPISKRQRLDDVVKLIHSMGGVTDCSAPIRYALEKRLKVDVIAIYTDGETWAGSSHSAEVLREYRKRINPDVKLINVAMTATQMTVGDPTDKNSLEVVGFDPSAVNVMNEFVKGFDE